MASTTTQRLSAFQAEVAAQWRAALAAKRAAEADGDGWLAELMAGRLDDLRELVRHHGGLAVVPATA